MSLLACPHCGNNSLIPVYAHRLCDHCGWHTPNFEDVQFRKGIFDNPILDFVSDMMDPLHSFPRGATEDEIRSRAISWCSRWMPEKLSGGKTEIKPPKELAKWEELREQEPEVRSATTMWTGTKRALGDKAREMYKLGEIKAISEDDAIRILCAGYVDENSRPIDAKSVIDNLRARKKDKGF
jgi:hypothetical protein